jgi:large subunit ribosomal protein L25
MDTSLKIEATVRPSSGKGPARRARAAGKLPAVVYGPGKAATSVAIDPKSVKAALLSPMGRNTVFTLSIDGKDQLAMVKSFEYHPVTRELEHADLYTVTVDHAIRVEVPLVLVGKCKGVAAGGIMQQIYRKLPVFCTPDKIPAKLELDVTALEMNQTMPAKSVVLPAGARVMLDPNHTIVSVVAPEKEKAEAVVAGADAAAPAAAAKAAAPAAGAPAKDAKAAAPAAKKK